MIDLPPPDYEQTIAAISACEIPAANIRVAYEDGLQSDVVTISDLGDVTEQKLQCVRQAIHPFYILTIANGDQQAAYHAFDRRESRPAQRAEAIASLRAQGLIDRVPRFDPAEGVEAFAFALEAGCGLAAGSALILFDSTTLTFRRDFVQRAATPDAIAKFGCLTQMIAASDAEEHGIRFGFVGNEAVDGDSR